MARGEGFHYVVTPNPELVELARNDADYRTILINADLVLPDGIGVVYAAKLLGRPLKSRVPGIDFASGLLAQLAKTGERLFLLGAKPGVAEKAAQSLRKEYPGLLISGVHVGYFKEDAPVVKQIREAGADVVFVCLGAPKQEKWIADHLTALGVPVCIGVGGVFNFLTGRIPRAPQWVQQLGLEWCFRLLLEPRRLWKRYLVDDTQALVHAVLYSRRQRALRAARRPRPAPS
jgi:N-acetylglucosaminyldiphosphoundecaprenol N-acetyl-beta-D-mannosaminyltransferase